MTTINIKITQVKDGIVVAKTLTNLEQTIITETVIPYNTILTATLNLLDWYSNQITYAEHIYIWSTMPKNINDKLIIKNKTLKRK